MRKKEREKITCRIVRKIDGKREIRFVPMEVPKNYENKKVFTKRNHLPRFKYVVNSSRSVVLDQVKSIGWLGSDILVRIFPEYEKATMGQLIRRYANENPTI